MKYNFKTQDWKDSFIELSDELYNQVKQANNDYKTAKDYVMNYQYDIWRDWYKSYHLSTYDRKVQLWAENWRQNITIWLVRSFVDVLKSVIQEKPLTFIWTWVNKAWIANKDNILQTLTWISDVSWFHKQLKDTMGDWLITWEFCLRIWYKKTKPNEQIISTVNWELIEETIESEEMNFPYASNISIFNIYPDPYSWPLRYVTERWVVPYKNFIETFWHLIRNKDNKSPFKNDDFLKTLPINHNLPGTDFTDYWNIINQVHQKINEDLQQKDKYLLSTFLDRWTNANNANFDEQTDVTEWLIEFKITTYDTRVVLLANNYPVYIWKNIYWFINYIVKASNDTKMRFWEWVPYCIWALERVWNSFINNYFDSARSIANPTLVVDKNLILEDEELENWTPWGIIYSESNNPSSLPIYRLDKWGLQDFNILNLIQQIAQQITWISEYNLWQSTWERTASWALATTQSSNKRMWPYISNFLDALSLVGYMWLSLVKKFWAKEQFIYIFDENWNQIEKAFKNKDLLWQINISLQAEGMLWTVNELDMQKLISLYSTLAPSGFITSPELAKEIIKKAWYSPERFIVPEKANQIKPDNYADLKAPITPLENPEASLWEIIQQWVNSQINLWNKWQWQK